MKSRKTALLTEIISPYRIPVFNVIAKELGEQFKVFFYGKLGKRRSWEIHILRINFRYEMLPGICLQKAGGTPYFVNPTIIYHLWRFNPDVVISGGYNHPSSLLALFYAKLYGKRLILWSESNIFDKRSSSKMKRAYKEWFVKNCTEYVVPGKAAFEYLIDLGAPEEKVWIAPDAVDNYYFTEMSEKAEKRINEFKEKKGYPKKVLLYVGRLIKEKGVLDLLKAFEKISDKKRNLGLVLVGKGGEEENYKNFCAEKNLKNIFFEGFIPQSQLPVYYAAADVFVLPTYSDTWGLVLNEAMACKLPVISSNVAGASFDLIDEGRNGFTFKKGNIDDLVCQILRVLNGNIEKMGEESFKIIKNYSPKRCAQGFVEVIRQTKNLTYGKK